MSHKVRTDLEIISSAAGQSGLKLTNLVAGTPASTFNGVLGLDASGNVIKIDSTKLAIVTVSAVAPSSPAIGQQWLNTSISPSELMIWNGTSWEQANDEVQHYANLAAFPATGAEGVVYIADDTDVVYVWDGAAYQDVTTLPSGLFSISDGTTTVPVAPSDTITFQENANIGSVLKFEVASGDIVEIQAVAGHTSGQAMVSNGTDFVYQTVGRKFAATITPVVNVAQTVTHGLTTTDIIVQAYDVTLNELVSVEITNRTANTVDITSTTTDQLRIVVLG